MGVDASIFAVEAKRYFYFDRYYKWTAYSRLQWRPDDEKTAAPGEQILAHLKDAVRIVQAGEDGLHRHERFWIAGIRAFVADHPGDRFFIRHDHDLPPSYDRYVRYGGKYAEWEPPLDRRTFEVTQ